MPLPPCKKPQPTNQTKPPQTLNDSHQRHPSKHLKGLNIPILRNMNRIWIGNQAVITNLVFCTSLSSYIQGSHWSYVKTDLHDQKPHWC